MTEHVTLLSAGGGSWKAAKIVQARLQPGDTHRLLFTDTLYEDADAYRFLIEGAANVFGRRLNWIPQATDFPDYRASPETPIEDYAGNPVWRAFLEDVRERAALAVPELVWIVEGRDPWEVFRDRRFLGNSGVDPCSQILKRQMLDKWLAANCDPNTTVLHYGIGEHEKHRFDDGEQHGIRPRLAAKGWRAEAPLVGTVDGLISPSVLMRAESISPPRLYAKGYIHNNCGGFCCKAGQAHYANRFHRDPERLAYDVLMEQKLRDFLGADVSMLSDRTGGTGKRPLTLFTFRERLQHQPGLAFTYDDDSGCGCMTDEAA